MNKGIFSLLGFLLAALGFLSIVLSLVGVQFSFLTWLDSFGRLFGFVAKLVMIIAGILILHIAQSDFKGEQGMGEY
ncbi:MAG: hypothetical protein KDD19_22455 [Phaeodactylibacter sp.]|nr:hypothetical protein [Phaeodactylibacter sp.]MCB9049885.1 hypothetical protein [Lewinellaceae bacterium]